MAAEADVLKWRARAFQVVRTLPVTRFRKVSEISGLCTLEGTPELMVDRNTACVYAVIRQIENDEAIRVWAALASIAAHTVVALDEAVKLADPVADDWLEFARVDLFGYRGHAHTILTSGRRRFDLDRVKLVDCEDIWDLLQRILPTGRDRAAPAPDSGRGT